MEKIWTEGCQEQPLSKVSYHLLAPKSKLICISAWLLTNSLYVLSPLDSQNYIGKESIHPKPEVLLQDICCLTVFVSILLSHHVDFLFLYKETLKY